MFISELDVVHCEGFVPPKRVFRASCIGPPLKPVFPYTKIGFAAVGAPDITAEVPLQTKGAVAVAELTPGVQLVVTDG